MKKDQDDTLLSGSFRAMKDHVLTQSGREY